MIEKSMNLFDAPEHTWIGITTNGTVKSNGRLVMGRGVAQQARDKYPNLDLKLGKDVKRLGNSVIVYERQFDNRGLFTFPVKYNWWELASLELIASSTIQLKQFCRLMPGATFYLPRPGCGNGGLKWEDVKPIIRFLPDNVIIVNI